MSNNNTVTTNQVEEILRKSKWDFDTKFGKTTIATCVLPNGFIIVESSSCVDPSNYDEEIGRSICVDRIRNKVWELEGYVLQSKQ